MNAAPSKHAESRHAGTVRRGAALLIAVALLADIAQAMRDASICGLGQTAASAIQSAVIQLKVLNV